MITEKKGRVTKGLGGLYEVRSVENGRVSVYSCRAKGVLKRDEDKVLVGDNVKILLDDAIPDSVVIGEIFERKNALIRPPLSNLDYIFIVFSAKKPSPVSETVDKLIAIAEHSGIIPVCVITKSDLDNTYAYELQDIYKGAGFDCFVTSSSTGEGVGELSAYIGAAVRQGRTAAFAGASGVGKSTLMNSLFPHLALATDEISRKIERGRHTTRHVELFAISEDLDTGFLADTPGFSLIDFARFDFFGLDDLPLTFREFKSYVGKCRYVDCSHVGEGEEDCAIIRAVRQGKISPSRHASYASIRSVLKDKKPYES